MPLPHNGISYSRSEVISVVVSLTGNVAERVHFADEMGSKQYIDKQIIMSSVIIKILVYYPICFLMFVWIMTWIQISSEQVFCKIKPATYINKKRHLMISMQGYGRCHFVLKRLFLE